MLDNDIMLIGIGICAIPKVTWDVLHRNGEKLDIGSLSFFINDESITINNMPIYWLPTKLIFLLALMVC